MAESHVISALTSKRAELAGIIQHHQKEISRLSEEVKTLDATIKLFEPDYRIQGIRPKQYRRKNQFFGHGEAHKLVLDIIRRNKPITATAVVAEVATMKSFNMDDAEFPKFKDSVKFAIQQQKRKGVIVEVGKENGCFLLSLA